MDAEKIVNEMETIVSNLDGEDETSDDYKKMVQTIARLQDIEIKDKDFKLKKERNDFDEDLRVKQFELEKKKFKLDRDRMMSQHEERMAEIEVNRIKAENEKEILKQNQEKAEKQFKETKRKDILMFCAKALGLFTIVGINVLMHKDELYYERAENGLVPQRCKTYDAVVGRLSENVMR